MGVPLIYYSGQDVGLTATVMGPTGVPATGDLTVVLTVTDPAGTTTEPAVVSAGGGLFTAVVDSVGTPGVWLYRWTASGDVDWADEGQFSVRPLGIEQLVDLPSVKAHLNLPATDSSHDAELQGFVLAAAELARDVVGPVLPEQHTEWHDGGSPVISLDWSPVASVQSVTEYIATSAWDLADRPLGTSLDSYEFTADLDLGLITRRATGDAVCFPAGRSNVKVVYTAGTNGSVPWSVRLGALELIRHLYQLTQQSGRPTWNRGALDGDSGGALPVGFAIPNRVLELWAPHKRLPGFA